MKESNLRMPLLYTFSSFVLILITLGILYRRHWSLHRYLMLTAFFIDVSIVIVVELNRQALEHVLWETQTNFVYFHILVSLVTLVLYFFLFISGSKMLNMKMGKIPFKHNHLYMHRAQAGLFVLMRIINYITSFSMPEQLFK
jgi:hypothetical protein